MLIQVTQDLHLAADVVGTIVSLPLLASLVQVVRYLGKIEKGLELNNQAFETHASTVNGILARQQGTVDDHSQKIAVLWDGHERRAAPRNSN